MAELKYTVQDYMDNLDFYAGVTEDNNSKKEISSLKHLSYDFVDKKMGNYILDDSDFQDYLSKSHDEFIDELLDKNTNPFLIKDRRTILNTFINKYDEYKARDANDYEKSINFSEKGLLCCESTTERILFIENLYNILIKTKDTKKNKYTSYYSYIKKDLDRLKEASNKIESKYSPLSVKIYTSVIIVMLVLIAAFIVGIKVPFLMYEENLLIQTGVVLSFALSFYIAYKSSSCGAGIISLIVLVVGLIVCSSALPVDLATRVYLSLFCAFVTLLLVKCLISESKRKKYHQSEQARIDKANCKAIHDDGIRFVTIMINILDYHIKFIESEKFKALEEKYFKNEKHSPSEIINLLKKQAGEIRLYYKNALDEFKSVEYKYE